MKTYYITVRSTVRRTYRLDGEYATPKEALAAFERMPRKGWDEVEGSRLIDEDYDDFYITAVAEEV